jgi:hypothetical protein
VPETSGFEVRFIRPRLDILLGELLRDLTYGGLVHVIVMQENIKDFRVGVLCVHTRVIL